MSCIYHKKDIKYISYESDKYVVGFYLEEDKHEPSIFIKTTYEITDDDTNEWIECEGLYKLETSICPVGILNLINELISNEK